MSLQDYAYYYTLRSAARLKVAKSLNEKMNLVGSRIDWGNLTLSSINKEALSFARTEWPKYYSAKTHNGFADSWETLLHKFSARPSMFDIAIWQKIGEEYILQGMALGKPSNAKEHLTIYWIERFFGENYLKGGVLIPILSCAEEYAKLLGCKKVLIKSPVDAEKYERYGYAPCKLPKVSEKYLGKDL